MSIQYTVMTFKPTTFKLQISPYNHSTRAPENHRDLLLLEQGLPSTGILICVVTYFLYDTSVLHTKWQNSDVSRRKS